MAYLAYLSYLSYLVVYYLIFSCLSCPSYLFFPSIGLTVCLHSCPVQGRSFIFKLHVIAVQVSWKQFSSLYSWKWDWPTNTCSIGSSCHLQLLPTKFHLQAMQNSWQFHAWTNLHALPKAILWILDLQQTPWLQNCVAVSREFLLQ